jgi:hypothetical protein
VLAQGIPSVKVLSNQLYAERIAMLVSKMKDLNTVKCKRCVKEAVKVDSGSKSMEVGMSVIISHADIFCRFSWPLTNLFPES